MGYINPLLEMPELRPLLLLPREHRMLIAHAFRGMRRVNNDEAELAWKRRKAPMALYGRWSSTYARHFAHALEKPQPHDAGSASHGVPADQVKAAVAALLEARRAISA